MPQNTAETRISMHDAYDKHSSIQKAAMEAGLKYLPTFPDRRSSWERSSDSVANISQANL